MLKEQAEAAAQHVRRLKVERCAQEGRIDIVPMLELHRGDKPVALVFIDPAQETLLRDLQLCIIGFDADAAFFSLEGYQRRSSSDTNPVTGEPWGHGDYQDLAENHDGLAKGWVVECLSTFGVNRAGDILVVNDEYRFEDDVPVFKKSITVGTQPDEKLIGRFPRVLIHAMNQPSASQEYMKVFGLEHLPERTSRDASVGKILSGLMQSRICLIATDGDDRRYEDLKGMAEAHPNLFKSFEPGQPVPPETFMNREQRRAFERDHKRGNA